MRRQWMPAAAVVLILTGCSGGDPEAAPTVPSVPGPSSAPAPQTPTTAAATATAATGAAPSATPSRSRTRRPSPAGGGGPAAFVAVVRARVPEVALDRRDEEISAIAGLACTSLKKGEDADTVVAVTRSLGTADAEATDEATARELVKLAIDTVCFDQRGRVDEF